jgi:hypothetical protein
MSKRDIIYATFETIEEQVAHCYFVLHEHFIANPPLAKFWVEAAMDELQHNSILRFCRERGLMSDVDIGQESIERVEQLLETVKSIVNDPEVTVDEAFYASLVVETSELDESLSNTDSRARGGAPAAVSSDPDKSSLAPSRLHRRR